MLNFNTLKQFARGEIISKQHHCFSVHLQTFLWEALTNVVSEHPRSMAHVWLCHAFRLSLRVSPYKLDCIEMKALWTHHFFWVLFLTLYDIYSFQIKCDTWLWSITILYCSSPSTFSITVLCELRSSLADIGESQSIIPKLLGLSQVHFHPHTCSYS